MSAFKTFPKSISTLFFFIGLFSSVSFRLIILVQHAHPSYVRIFWYLAVIANLIFFMFRYYIAEKRKSAIKKTALIEKLKNNIPLQPPDREAVLYLLTSIECSRESLNYLSISILSVVAILVDIILSIK